MSGSSTVSETLITVEYEYKPGSDMSEQEKILEAEVKKVIEYDSNGGARAQEDSDE